MIEFRCGNCNQKIVTEDALSGKRIRCPKCSNICTVPDSSNKIKFHCKSCGQKISVPEVHAGKKGKCPQCKSIVVIPQVAPPQLADGQTVDSSSQKPGIDSLMFDVPPPEHAPAQSFEQQEQANQEQKFYHALSPTMAVRQEQAPMQRKQPWPIDIFLYPTNAPGLTMLGILMGVPLLIDIVLILLGLLTLRFPPVVVFVMFFGIIGSLVRVVLYLYAYCYYCECIRDSAEGGIRAPETLAKTPGLGEMFWQLLRVIVCVVFFFLPMGLLAVIMFDSFSGPNPILIVGSIISTFLPYCGLVLFFCAFCLLVLITRGVLLGGGILLQSQILFYISKAVNMYLLMIGAHLVGRFYWRYQERLYWEV